MRRLLVLVALVFALDAPATRAHLHAATSRCRGTWCPMRSRLVSWFHDAAIRLSLLAILLGASSASAATITYLAQARSVSTLVTVQHPGGCCVTLLDFRADATDFGIFDVTAPDDTFFYEPYPFYRIAFQNSQYSVLEETGITLRLETVVERTSWPGYGRAISSFYVEFALDEASMVDVSVLRTSSGMVGAANFFRLINPGTNEVLLDLGPYNERDALRGFELELAGGSYRLAAETVAYSQDFNEGLIDATLRLRAIPEPGTGLLVMTGVLGLAASRRRRAS